MAIDWTEDQLKAITERNRTILVSAAAGSGKTAVLVERVIRRIIYEEHDIDEFLIVTFTRAAAAEMRSKIAEAITDKLLELPGNRHLRRQLSLLDRAMICTVDSFCSSVLRENFRAAGVSADFRTADDIEIKALKSEILDDLIEEQYGAENNDGFIELMETFSDMRSDENLHTVILDTYNKIQSHPFPSRWLAKNLALAEDMSAVDPAQSLYGKRLIEIIKKRCFSIKSRYAAAFALMDEYSDVYECYFELIKGEYDAFQAFYDSLDCGCWDSIRNCYANITFKRSPPYGKKNLHQDIASEVKEIRDKCKKLIVSIETHFNTPAEKITEDSAAVLPGARTLFALVEEFDVRFTEEKRRRNIMDFNEIAHAVINLLIGSMSDDGKIVPSELAVNMSQRFTEIMVDEYQDTNAIQDSIFRALSRNEENLFMVGDVKQSIYRFRLADPTIFLQKYLSFSDNPAEGEPIRIVLSSNFRSRKAVLESINYIFDNIMTSELGDVDYMGKEDLHYGGSYKGEDSPSEFCFVETEGIDDDDDMNKNRADAVYTARRIHELLQEHFQVKDDNTFRDIRPDDIAILLRGTKSHAADYIHALEDENIPVFAMLEDDLFEAPEISMLMAMLEVVDNPYEDIPLAALMRSVFYGFTADELADIRIHTPKGGFYQAALAYCELENDTALRCRRMLDDIDAYRRDAVDMPSDRLILKIIEETGFESLIEIMYGDSDRRSNIRSLAELAGGYERNGYKGLYSFLNMIRSCREHGGISKPSRAASSAVCIMTIHKSKGLEFPVVFLSRAMGQFNLDDTKKQMLIHPEMGVGFKRHHIKRHIKYPTFAYNAIKEIIKRETLSEEMRILYVALTRAKEKLIVVSAVKGTGKLLKNHWADASSSPVDPTVIGNASSPEPWFCIPFSRLPEATMILQEKGITRVAPEDNNHSWVLRSVSPVKLGYEKATEEDDSTAVLPFSPEELDRRLGYVYPYLEASDSPSKVTATSLKGRYTDAEVSEDTAPVHERQKHFARPKFMMEQGLTAAERGTAQHLTMQMIDYKLCNTLDNIRAQIEDMERRALLSPEQAKAVNCRKIYSFFSSALGKRLMASDSITREFKFSLLAASKKELTADDIKQKPMPGEDTILFQGVIDCFFIEDGKIVLIDFKTDRISRGQEEKSAEHYAPQLKSYSAALERIYNIPVKSAYLYFFSTDCFYEV